MPRVQWISVLVTILAMLGCASNPLPTVDQLIGRRPYSGAIWTTDGMYLVARGPGALFIASSPVNLNVYRGVMLDEIRISSKEGSRNLHPQEEEWLRASLRRGLLRLFGGIGAGMARAPFEGCAISVRSAGNFPSLSGERATTIVTIAQPASHCLA